MAQTAELRFGDKSIELPLVEGTEQERAVDIERLRAETGLITLDPGYANTGSCESSITFIDGEQGILRYRGYPIEELAEKCSFLECSYLLVNGELPNQQQLDTLLTETVSDGGGDPDADPDADIPLPSLRPTRLRCPRVAAIPGAIFSPRCLGVFSQLAAYHEAGSTAFGSGSRSSATKYAA